MPPGNPFSITLCFHAEANTNIRGTMFLFEKAAIKPVNITEICPGCNKVAQELPLHVLDSLLDQWGIPSFLYATAAEYAKRLSYCPDCGIVFLRIRK